MLSFTPTEAMEKALRDMQGLIAYNQVTLETLPPEELEYLRHNAFISSIGASTRIENAVLTDNEINWVDTVLTSDGKTTAFEARKAYIFDKLSKDKERSIEEVAGCRDVLSTVYLQARDMAPLKEADIRGLHHALLRYYPGADHYEGNYKTTSNRVISKNHDTGQEKIVLEPAAPGLETETAMTDLLQWYNQTYRDHPWSLLVATEFVFRFLAIHPFQDGNGRLGRALFLMCLLQSEDKRLTSGLPYISIDRHIEKNRATYYTVLQQCSDGKFRADPKEYQIEHLARFFMAMMKDALEDIDFYRKKYALYQDLPDSHRTVLQCFKARPETRLQLKDIEGELSLSRSTVIRALNSLSKNGFLLAQGKGPARKYQLMF